MTKETPNAFKHVPRVLNPYTRSAGLFWMFLGVIGVSNCIRNHEYLNLTELKLLKKDLGPAVIYQLRSRNLGMSPTPLRRRVKIVPNNIY